MTNDLTCQRCGAALVKRAPEGLCPRCLLESAVRLAVSDSGEVHQPSTSDQSAVHVSKELPFSGKFGQYELLERIAAGGMGVVYKARQLGLNRIVAIKVLPYGHFTREEFVQRFQLEASAAAKLRHPNIVTIFEVGTADTFPFFSMEYVEGATLADLVGNQPLAVARAVRLVRTIAEAIHYAHGEGILHRDLKPSNVLIDPLDQPRITDFGLARDLKSDAELTTPGQAIGSPNFMPPEQAEGRHADISARSDIYALGAMLYYLLIGRPPFAADSVLATLQQVIQNEPVPPRLLNPGLPRDLETICLKCLAKDPLRRYATAQEIADELGRFQHGEPIQARPISAAEIAWRWCRRRPAVTALLAALAITLSAGFAATFWQWQRAKNAASDLATTVTRLQMERAEDRLARGETAEGLALLANLLRRDPANRTAAYRILSVLTLRNFVLPEETVIQDDYVGRNSALAQHGHWLVTATNNAATLQLWRTDGTLRLERTMPCNEPIRTTSFRSDGAQLVAATSNGVVMIFNVPDGTMAAGPHRLRERVERVLVSPDGRQILAHLWGPGGDDWRRAKLRVVDSVTGSVLREEPKMQWAEFSHNGQWLVTLEGNVAQIHDAVTWQLVGKSLAHGGRINMAEFSSDSSLLVTASADNTARIWRVKSSEPVGAPLRHPVQVLEAVLSSDAKHLLSYDLAGRGRLWDVARGQMLGDPFVLSKGIGRHTFTSDGSMFVTHIQNKFWVRDTTTGEPVFEATDTGNRITRAQFLGDSRHLLTGSFGGDARVWDATRANAREIRLEHKAEINAAAFSPDAAFVATAGKDATAKIWDTKTGKFICAPLVHSAHVNDISFSPDGRQIATAADDTTVRLWELPSGKPIGSPLKHQRRVSHVSFSRDGRWLITSSDDKAARLWNADDLRPVGPPLRHHDRVTYAAFSPNGKLAVTVGEDNTAWIWHVPEGTSAAPPMLHSNWVSFAEFSPDSRHLATCSSDRTARIWDVQTGRETIPPFQHERPVGIVHFDPNGKRLVTASYDGTVRIWDTTTGKTLTRPLLHTENISSAEFSPDGRFVLTASRDSTARIWDASTGQPVTDPLRHDVVVTTARWSADSRWIVTASFDGRVRIWPTSFLIDAAPPAWLPELAEAVGGKGLANDDLHQRVRAETLFTLRQQLTSREDSGPYERWANWFFFDRTNRLPASPARP